MRGTRGAELEGAAKPPVVWKAARAWWLAPGSNLDLKSQIVDLKNHKLAEQIRVRLKA